VKERNPVLYVEEYEEIGGGKRRMGGRKRKTTKSRGQNFLNIILPLKKSGSHTSDYLTLRCGWENRKCVRGGLFSLSKAMTYVENVKKWILGKDLRSGDWKRKATRRKKKELGALLNSNLTSWTTRKSQLNVREGGRKSNEGA